ncbi:MULTISPECIES: hypothetical protein [Exiguobacterium]|uniref:hypothetical protein n=1 Tax=Exiguobacterium TaxID=33986 RepID=UPI001BE96606|nr:MULTISPECIES: hypothetical protein [Exiguobacterium]MCT4776819.1 hypothetical protein [Exiguobacterium aquaticum]MCT4790288.1 hypothetical protein [Exiguobacterium mexicanum]
MRWMIRLGLTAVLTVGAVFVGLRLISLLMEWWYEPPTSGLKLRPTPEAFEDSNEMFEGTMRHPKEDEQSLLKLDYLDYTIDSVATVIERGDGLFYLVLLLACVLLSVLIFAANIRFQHRKRADETASFTTRTFSRHSVPSSMTSVEEPAWTGVTIRDALIAFNQALPPAKKWLPTETVSEWARRIELTDVDFKSYLDERYGMTDPVTPEQVARFRTTLEQYENRSHH